jgi:hypothetical protein
LSATFFILATNFISSKGWESCYSLAKKDLVQIATDNPEGEKTYEFAISGDHYL